MPRSPACHAQARKPTTTRDVTLMARADAESAGRWRDQQRWIGGSQLGPHSTMFVPPVHQRVPGLIDDLVAFIARDDSPVLAHAALAHAQFETIHPFEDGNGGTGRALVHSMLRSKGLTRTVTVPIWRVLAPVPAGRRLGSWGGAVGIGAHVVVRQWYAMRRGGGVRLLRVGALLVTMSPVQVPPTVGDQESGQRNAPDSVIACEMFGCANDYLAMLLGSLSPR